MPVRWSPLKVSEAAGIIEEHIANAATPLTLAKEEVIKAMRIPHLPQYMEQNFRGLEYDLKWAISRLNTRIETIRRELPKDTLAAEEKRRELGETSALFAQPSSDEPEPDAQLPESICDDGTIAI